MTPTSEAGAPGTGVVTSSTTTSRASVTFTANGRPPSITRQARRAGATGRSSTAGASTLTVVSADKPPHHREQLIGGERLGQIAVGALTPAPCLVALLVLRRHQHDRRCLRLLVLLERAQQLEAVALGQDDVEQHHVGPLAADLVLERFAVDERHHLVSRVSK